MAESEAAADFPMESPSPCPMESPLPSPSLSPPDDDGDDLDLTGAAARKVRKQRKEAAEAARLAKIAQRLAAKRTCDDELELVAESRSKVRELKVLTVVANNKGKGKGPVCSPAMQKRLAKLEKQKEERKARGEEEPAAAPSPSPSPTPTQEEAVPDKPKEEPPADGPKEEPILTKPGPAPGPEGPLLLRVCAEEGVEGLGWAASAAPPAMVLIKAITPGLWAEISGLHVGDRLVSLNGRDLADGVTAAEMKAALRARPVQCVFAREDRLDDTVNAPETAQKEELTQKQQDKKDKRDKKDKKRKDKQDLIGKEGNGKRKAAGRASGRRKKRRRGRSSDDSVTTPSSDSTSTSSVPSSEAMALAKELAQGPAPSFAWERPMPIKPAAEMSLLPTRMSLTMGGGGGPAAQGPASSEVECFLLASLVDRDAQQRMRALPTHLQKMVTDRGPIGGCTNTSSVLLARIRDAELGRVIAPSPGMATNSAALTQAMFKPSNDERVEKIIRDHGLNSQASGMLRMVPPTDRQTALDMCAGLGSANNASQHLISQLSTVGRMSGACPWMPPDANQAMANFGGGNKNIGQQDGRL